MRLNILTWNLRYDAQPDGISVKTTIERLSDPMVSPAFLGKRGEQPWSDRRIRVAQLIRNQGAAVVALQEALIRQVNDLQELLGSDWTWVGVGRDDGKQAGEFNPIFYDKTKLTLVKDYDTFWLSDTPFRPSRYPGAGSYRIATVAQFQNSDVKSQTGKPLAFTLINTHLDERSEAQRRLGASLLLVRCRYEAANGGSTIPVFVVGDFNSEQSGKDSGAYRVLTGALPPTAIPEDFENKYKVPDDSLPAFTMLDTRSTTPRIAVSGDFRTFTGFDHHLGQSEYGRIDYVLGGASGGWQSHRYITSSTLSDDGMLISDHRPVTVDVELE